MSTIEPLPTLLISGRARSGKNTLATKLSTHLLTLEVALADGVREQALALDPLIHVPTNLSICDRRDPTRRSTAMRPGDYPLSTLVETYGWEEVKRLPAVRRLLQRLGTEAGFVFWGDPGLWVDRMVENVRVALEQTETRPELLVVTDVRMTHEWERLVSHPLLNCRHVHLVRPQSETLSGDAATHRSEAELERLGGDADLRLVNDGDPEDLVNPVLQLLADRR